MFALGIGVTWLKADVIRNAEKQLLAQLSTPAIIAQCLSGKISRMTTTTPIKVAAAHVAPVFLDRDKSIDKACSIIHEAAANGAQLVAFPETFIPAFPVWLSLRAPIHNHGLFHELVDNAMRADGPEMAKLCKAAREANIFVSMGFNESVDSSVGTIFNSNVLINNEGAVLNHHRKLVPTFYEKLVWSPGDGGGLRVCNTPIGKIGMLICGENTNPLARYTLIAQGQQIHIANYPPIWPTHPPAPGSLAQANSQSSAESKPASNAYSLQDGIKIRGGNHAFEGKLFNIVVSAYLDKPAFDRLASLDKDAAHILENSPRGVSAVFGPSGLPITDIISEKEQLLYAEIDLAACVEPKQMHDIAGGYNRFDIFKLTVNREAQRPIAFEPAIES